MSEERKAPPPAEPAPKPKRSWLMGCLMTVLIVGCALALIAGICIHRVNKQHEAFSRHVRVLLAACEAARPVVPDEENAAEFYREAVKLRPPAADLAYEVFDDPPSKAAEVKTAVAECRAFLDALDRAMERPGCLFPADLSGGAPELSHVRRLRDGCVVVLMAARHEALAGNAGKARLLLGKALRIAGDLGRGGPQWARMNQNICEDHFCESLIAVLNRCEPGQEDLAALLAGLRRYRAARESAGLACDREKVVNLAILEGILSGRIQVKREFGDPARGERLALVWWRLSGKGIEFARGVERLWAETAMLAASPGPEAFDRAEPLDERDLRLFSGLPELLNQPPFMSLARDVSPSTRVEGEAESLARLDLAELALGCRLCRLRTGNYPESLANLSAKLPEDFKALPTDPYSGNGYLYRRTEQGCKLWSVWRNRKDEGGKAPVPWRRMESGDYDLAAR